MNTFAAIPTVYRGIQMRSRLEAKWACMFDQLGWKWEYEPIDLNGWIPDFVIAGHNSIFVDVKPRLGGDLDQATSAKLRKALGSDETADALILASTIFETEIDRACIGWITDCYFGTWQNAVIIDPIGIPGVYGLASGCEGAYQDRITGAWDGDHLYSPTKPDIVRALWAKATNTVQWRTPR